MRRIVMLALLSGSCLLAAAHAPTPVSAVSAAPAKEPSPQPGFALSDASAKPWTGDLDGMIKRRMIRALVPYSKTYYFTEVGSK